ncbi:MAG: ABC transporter permease [Alphaproteobacteria bacterium]|nr:ABC transporter permease [Alphaproteobacteria bacterium]
MSASAITATTRTRAWQGRPGLLIVGALGLSAAIYLLPMLVLVRWAFTDPKTGTTLAQFAKVLAEDAYHTAFVTTFRTAAITTIVCAALGYPLAYLMATTGPRARMLLAAAVMIPFWTSVLARSLAWVILLGRKGLVNTWLVDLGVLDQPLPMLFNSLGVQIGMAHVLLPFMVLPCWAVLMRMDRALPIAARSLGASPARAFAEVVLPLSLPGLLAGCVLVFIMAVGFYITPALLGGDRDITIAGLIEMVVRDLLDWPFGAALSLTLLCIVGAIFASGAWLVGAERLIGQGGHS